jgi:orotidine-5'-phosphate decarboxylase
MFEMLERTEGDYERLVPAAGKHMESLCRIAENFRYPQPVISCPERSPMGMDALIGGYVRAFGATGSPYVVNLDLNCSEDAEDFRGMLKESKRITEHMKKAVRATARHVSGYKMNEQSMLTFLLAEEPGFVHEAKEIYGNETGVEPVIWTDEKLRDIPSTTYQTAMIIYGLGYDAIHCMPQIGPDVAGALHAASRRMGGKGTVHVINLTHPGYLDVKRDYFKDPVGTVDLMRKRALGHDTEVDAGNSKFFYRVRASGTIEPANRPDELYQGRKDIYGDDILIISIGIGPQGALPGCALYAGASVEGIGRFIFEDGKGFSSPADMKRKSRACKRSCLRALDARYSDPPERYPLDEVMQELSGFDPGIKDMTREGLEKVYRSRLEDGAKPSG